MAQTDFGNYVLGLAGLGLIRGWYTEQAAAARERLLDVADGYSDNEVLSFTFATPELEMREGYTRWSETYDGPNPMIAAEEAVVTPLFQELFKPGMVALDAGCGTGRHAATLDSLGYDVIGTDLTPAMLNVAKLKVPAADFREGTFEQLPVDDQSVDLVVSALAVCHAVDLSLVFSEFARVLRPGGRIVISDPHPATGDFGGQAFFKGAGTDMPFVRNRAHPVSTYINAMVQSGFGIDRLTELPYDQAVIEALPSYPLYPEISTAALLGVPFVIIWEATL